MNQRGFIQLSLTAWLLVAASVAFAGMSIALKVQSSRLASVKQEYATFQATVKTQGELAAREAARINADNLKRKETADAAHKKLLTANAALTRQLRDGHPAGSGVPEAPAATRRPDLYCADRSEFRAAYGVLVTDLRAIADRCAADAVDLESVRTWGKSLGQ